MQQQHIFFILGGYSHNLVPYCLQHNCFSYSPFSSSETKYNQIEVVNIEAIEELLDTMHMGCDYDIMGDSLWDEVMLVRPPKVDLVEPTQSGAFEG